ncbi:CPBP family intramembrane glutamic endopeptidase [Methylibium rhizosphaerae]|uniref:CPBP family intramembrane glutamic endopeptidase n=1 Tax=Methylibium rhizosphaerae TaxID=2570323 RepID=UPI00112C4236|nr:CPBP family intramembrane glutamic endopeptidase [Methylibium rhizosphaerae]
MTGTTTNTRGPARRAASLLPAAVGPLACLAMYGLGAAGGVAPMLASLLLAGLLFGAVQAGTRWAAACFALAGVVLLAMAAGAVPGFGRVPLDGAAGGASVNAAKAVAGLAAVAMFPSHWAWNRRCTFIAAACLAGVPLLALSLGFVRWAPAAIETLLAFALANLFTVLAEEWFFRHWVQRPLMRWGAVVSVAVSALLFGLAHLGGGTTFAVLATVAGLAYAGVWRASGGSLWAAAALHWALNLLRVTFFG